MLQDPWEISKLLEMKHLNHFQFIAELASALHNGGAYCSLDCKGEKALEVATLCYKEWAANHEFNAWELSFYQLGNQWNLWFSDVAWDNAWISYDYKAAVFTVLAITDND